MNDVGASILRSLQDVSEERARRVTDPALGLRVSAVKRFQHARFTRSYADLLADARYAKAAEFFLDDLYGPSDFTERDAQFVRIVPALVRLFPDEIVRTVSELASLHALSERLDSAMGLAIESPDLDGHAYAVAWRLVDDAPARERQIALMVAVGAALDRYTRNLLLRQTLRFMRAPAQAAGLGALQGFLERGFDTFKSMRGAHEFLSIIAQRERGLAALLFAGGEVTDVLAAGDSADRGRDA